MSKYFTFSTVFAPDRDKYSKKYFLRAANNSFALFAAGTIVSHRI